MLRVNAVSKRFRRPKMPERIQEELSDCNPLLPCLLAVFSEHDAVEGVLVFVIRQQGLIRVRACWPANLAESAYFGWRT